jgi:hypothetical protein
MKFVIVVTFIVVPLVSSSHLSNRRRCPSCRKEISYIG